MVRSTSSISSCFHCRSRFLKCCSISALIYSSPYFISSGVKLVKRSRGCSAVFAIEPGLLFVLLQERFASAAPARLLRGLTLDKAFVLKREFAENSRLVSGWPAL